MNEDAHEMAMNLYNKISDNQQQIKIPNYIEQSHAGLLQDRLCQS